MICMGDSFFTLCEFLTWHLNDLHLKLLTLPYEVTEIMNDEEIPSFRI